MDMKRFFLYAIVIAALALAGCGGNGNGGMTAMPPDEPDTPMMCPQGQVGTYPNCAPPGPTDEEIAATTKAAGTKRTAIMAEADQTTDAGLGGSDAPASTDSQVEGEYNLNVKYGEVSIVVEGATAADDVTFVQAMNLGDGLTMHTRTMDADDDGNVMTTIL